MLLPIFDYHVLFTLNFKFFKHWLIFCLEDTFNLMTHNWEDWKWVFLLCPCHEIYRVEDVGTKSSSYALKIWILWGCKILTISLFFFDNSLEIKFESKKKSFVHGWHLYDYLWHITFHFCLIDFK